MYTHELSPENRELIQKELGWFPVTILAKVKAASIPQTIKPLISAIDNAVIQSSISMAGIVHARSHLNEIFNDVGGKSEVKTYLISMKSSFDKSLESYFKNVKDASRSFLEIGSIFGDLSDAMKYGADYQVMIEALSKIQITFGAKNEELEKEMNFLLENMKQSKQKLIELQDSNLIKRLEEQDKKIKNEYALCAKNKESYEKFVRDYHMRNLELETSIRRWKNEIEYHKKDIEQYQKEIDTYQDMDEYYNEFLKDSSEDKDTITRNQEKMIKEIEQTQQIAMEELNTRIKMIRERLFNLNSEIVHLSQLECKMPVHQAENKSLFWFWNPYSYNQKADLSPNRKITYNHMLKQKTRTSK